MRPLSLKSHEQFPLVDTKSMPFFTSSQVHANHGFSSVDMLTHMPWNEPQSNFARNRKLLTASFFCCDQSTFLLKIAALN